jgi:flagellar motor switch/type III secretory pathway protein FliN
MLVSDHHPGAVRDTLHHLDECLQIRHLLVINCLNDPAIVSIVESEGPSRLADEDTLDGDSIESSLLVREVMETGTRYRDESVRGDAVKIANLNIHLHILPTALKMELDGLTNVGIQDIIQSDKLADELTVDLDENITLLNLAIRGALGEDDLGHKHVGHGWELLAHRRLPLGAQTQPTALVERLEKELALDITTGDGLTSLDALERPQRSVQGEEIIGGSAIRSTASL